MRLRTFLGPIFLISCVAIGVTSVRPLFSRDVVVPVFGGTVFADGRPMEKAIMIRLQAENSAVIATTYTSDSGRFLFRNIEVVLEDRYLLVINEPGYKELRHPVESGYFVPDSAMPQIAHSSGSVILDIESLPPEKNVRKAGSKTIDTRQLRAEVSEEARREYNQGLKSAADGNSKEALAHLKKAVDLSPDYYDALARLGAEYLRAGQLAEARTILERTLAVNPNDPFALTNLGILHFQEGQRLESASADKPDPQAIEKSYRNAAELFEKALRLNALDARTSLYLGIAYYKMGEYEKSESLLVNTLALDSRMHQARLTLISIYSRQRRYDEALKQISEYLRANPNAPEKKRLEELRTRIQASSAQ